MDWVAVCMIGAEEVGNAIAKLFIPVVIPGGAATSECTAGRDVARGKVVKRRILIQNSSVQSWRAALYGSCLYGQFLHGRAASCPQAANCILRTWPLRLRF